MLAMIDPNPTIKIFDFHHEWKIGSRGSFIAIQWLWIIVHGISEEERENSREIEYSLED
jgi:hypothetical protein